MTDNVYIERSLLLYLTTILRWVWGRCSWTLRRWTGTLHRPSSCDWSTDVRLTTRTCKMI